MSETILLCEDSPQERLVKAFLKKCGRETTAPQFLSRVASRLKPGGNDRHVLQEFPAELQRCRNRTARTQLIVVIDADSVSVEERRRELDRQLRDAGHELLDHEDERAIVLIPRRHIETWLVCLLGESPTEEEDCKKHIRDPGPEHYRPAGGTLREWSRENAPAAPTCVPSLQISFPEWRKLG